MVVAPEANRPLLEHLEHIASGSHPSLGDEERATLRDILHTYTQVFPAPGEPVTGRTTAVQHDIETNGGRPVRFSPEVNTQCLKRVSGVPPASRPGSRKLPT